LDTDGQTGRIFGNDLPTGKSTTRGTGTSHTSCNPAGKAGTRRGSCRRCARFTILHSQIKSSTGYDYQNYNCDYFVFHIFLFI
jgi:hypothetical protein